MLKKLKGYMMPLAMTTGALLYQQVGALSFLVPHLIFSMLLLTYVKLSWKELHFSKLHLWLLLIQFAGSLLVYLLLRQVNPIIAQGVMICILAPTGTAAVVITGMLKGNVASLTAYSLASNLMVAVLAPVLFSFIGVNHELPFFISFIDIGKRVFFLLVTPLIIAYFLNKFMPNTSTVLKKYTGISFYLWSVALVIVSGKTVYFIVNQPESNALIEIMIATGALFACILQFLTGRKLGRMYGDTVAGGQGLGQKNTVLAIWMAQMYLNPISSIGPGAYVLWQNLFNSWQVWRQRKNI
ncbi:MAG: transporter [Paludibacter sp.]|nr:transporter [Paludibacter sp.]